jgi:hypothetical protein
MMETSNTGADVTVENKLRGCIAPGGWSCVIVAKQSICAVPHTRTCTAGNITLHYHGVGLGEVSIHPAQVGGNSRLCAY